MRDAIEEFTNQMLKKFHQECEKLGPPPPNYVYTIVDPELVKKNDGYVFRFSIGLKSTIPVSFED